MSLWLNRLRKRGPAAKALVLFGAVAVACLIGLPAAWLIGGWPGISAAAVAAVLCLCGALAALVVSGGTLGGGRGMVAGVLAGMLLRMALPLGVGLALHITGGALAQAGLLYYVLVFYPVTLTVETVLSLPATAAADNSPTEPKATC